MSATTSDVLAPRSPRPATRSRSLLSYLLLPRPQDLGKALVLPAGALLGAVATGGLDLRDLARVLVVWVILELLIYQARYQWNDARGFVADQSHPDGRDRGRLPGPLSRAQSRITTSLIVAGVRLAAAAALTVLLPGLQLGGVVLAATIGVFGAAGLYEFLRSAATGRTAAAPTPLTPALVGLWVAVGAGYAVRGMTGLALVVDLATHPALTVAATVMMWSLGVVFVTSRWSLESMPFATVSNEGIRWRAAAGQAREHTLGLVRWRPRSDRDADLRIARRGLTRWRMLRERTPMLAPWNLAGMTAATAAGFLGPVLTDPSAVLPAVAVATLGLGAAILVISAGSSRGLVALGAVGVLLLLLVAAGDGAAWRSVLPLAVALVAYAYFSTRCLLDLGHPFRALSRRGRTAAA